jgi:hypothetical protein
MPSGSQKTTATEQWIMCFVVFIFLQIMVVAGTLMKRCTLSEIRDGTLVCLGLISMPKRVTGKTTSI